MHALRTSLQPAAPAAVSLGTAFLGQDATEGGSPHDAPPPRGSSFGSWSSGNTWLLHLLSGETWRNSGPGIRGALAVFWFGGEGEEEMEGSRMRK